MIRVVLILITGLITSFYFFPFELNVLPGVNTKMLMACIGLVCLAVQLIKNKIIQVSIEFLSLLTIAAGISLMSLVSITLNQTPDTTYTTYILSFFIWLSAAYAVCTLIKIVHGYINVQLILEYLVGICIFQCVSAVVIDNLPAVQIWVDRHLALNQEFMHKVHRLYGVGASLDVAGARFAAVLVGLGFYLAENNLSLSDGKRIYYVISFVTISIVGSMISRTTLIGTVIGLVFVVVSYLFVKPTSQISANRANALITWASVIIIGVTLCIYLYNNNTDSRKLIRFAFEGFFSLVEKGHWETSSTEKLLSTMVVFPETLHTWIIGDGYFINSRYDINYLGNTTDQGYYMGTDVGYLRFIFYFGAIGLILMIGLIVYSAILCIRHFKNERFVFIMALIVGLTVWIKVATDVFLYFALFLSAASIQRKPLN